MSVKSDDINEVGMVKNVIFHNFENKIFSNANISDDNKHLPVRRSCRPIKKKKFFEDIFDSLENKKICQNKKSKFGKNVRTSKAKSNEDIEIHTDPSVEEDPDKVWCICKEPHNSRFMICCDRQNRMMSCKEWYHGSCVGVSEKYGLQLENQNKEWICPLCLLKSDSDEMPISTQKRRRHTEDYTMDQGSSVPKNEECSSSLEAIQDQGSPVQKNEECSSSSEAIQNQVSCIQRNEECSRSSEAILSVRYPPPPAKDAVIITNEELLCLKEGALINDTVILYFLKYLYHEKLSADDRIKTHMFDTFLYTRLKNIKKETQQNCLSSVKRWTNGIDIFSKDYILIPIAQKVHWFLVIICYAGYVADTPNVSLESQRELSSNRDGNEQNDEESVDNKSVVDLSDSENEKQREVMPSILIFDSLWNSTRTPIETDILVKFLEDAWKVQRGTSKSFKTIKKFVMEVPTQDNKTDCGLYLMQFAESFFQKPIQFGDPMPNLMDWFSLVEVTQKRQQIKELILRM